MFTNVKKNDQRYYRIENVRHKSKSGQAVRLCSTSIHYCSTKMSKHCKNKQYFTCSLNAWMGYSTM